MKLVVDASVAIKWAVEEDGRVLARALIQEANLLIAPDFVLVESASILWKKARIGEITREQAEVAVIEIRLPFSEMIPTASLADLAFKIALDLDHPIYDCLYVAAAVLSSASLVTADRRLLRAVVASPYEGLLVELGAAS